MGGIDAVLLSRGAESFVCQRAVDTVSDCVGGFGVTGVLSSE